MRPFLFRILEILLHEKVNSIFVLFKPFCNLSTNKTTIVKKKQFWKMLFKYKACQYKYKCISLEDICQGLQFLCINLEKEIKISPINFLQRQWKSDYKLICYNSVAKKYFLRVHVLKTKSSSMGKSTTWNQTCSREKGIQENPEWSRHRPITEVFLLK